MLKATVDTHTHTLASVHAYSTLLENLQGAKAKGLKGFATTDHAPEMGDTKVSFFRNLPFCIPPVLEGLRIFAGAELNIIDYEGHVDLEEKVLEHLELVIASAHTIPCMEPGTFEQHTQMYLGVAENPYVDVIGHCGQEAYAFDYERVLKKCKEYGKTVEINSHSFPARPGSDKNCVEIAKLCKKYEIPVVVSSDAHFFTQMGDFQPSLLLLEEIDFPEKLLMNRSVEVLEEHLPRARKGNASCVK